MDLNFSLSGIKLDALLLKEKNKVVSIAIILVSILAAVNIYKAQVKNIGGLRERKDVEFKKNDVINEINQLEKKMDFYKGLLIKRDAGSMINIIDDIAQEEGVKIVSLRPSAAQDFPLYTKQPFDLSVKAQGYHAIGRLISRLESHSDIFIVDTVKIKAAGDIQAAAGEGLSQGVNVDAELRLSAVSFKFN